MAKPRANKRNLWESVGSHFNLDFIGTIFALVLLSLSFTPSLLPRGPVVQGVASGLSFATGYGIGVLISFLIHKIPRRKRFIVNSKTKKIVIIIFVLLALIFMLASIQWQKEVRLITQAENLDSSFSLWVIVITIVLAWLLISAGRAIQRLARFFEKKIERWLGPKLSKTLGAILAAVLLIFLVNGVVLKGSFAFINFTFGLANKGTPAGIYQPQNNIYSGSPESKIDWNTLGEKGREFVATGPTKAEIEKFTGNGQGSQPSRLYVGMQSAPTLNERVDLIIKELDRTKASQRDAVLLAIPTGSGGINAKSVQSVEYLFNGNTTSIGIQYSHLPSWLSFLADQEIARENGKQLTEAVYNWWSHLDPNNRPKLLMYGESLGTLGADGAFSGASDMQSRMSGVLLVGPPHANQLWQNIVGNRDDKSREVLPVYQNGEAVRFSDGVTQFSNNPSSNNWMQNRVGIVQHGSDPVVWAATSLFFQKPDWLDEQRGSDVLPNMKWYPFVTAWQVALDLPFAFGATPGHGHRYSPSLPNAWVQVLNINLNKDKATQLQTIIDQVKG